MSQKMSYILDMVALKIAIEYAHETNCRFNLLDRSEIHYLYVSGRQDEWLSLHLKFVSVHVYKRMEILGTM